MRERSNKTGNAESFRIRGTFIFLVSSCRKFFLQTISCAAGVSMAECMFFVFVLRLGNGYEVLGINKLFSHQFCGFSLLRVHVY